MQQTVSLSGSENAVLVAISGATYIKLFLDVAIVGEARPSTVGNYKVEWANLVAGIYVVDTDGTINSITKSNAPTILPENERFTNKGLEKVSIGEPSDIEGVPVVSTAPYTSNRQYFEIGNGASPYDAIPGASNIFDLVINNSMTSSDHTLQFFGGEFFLDGNVKDGDYLEFSVVDKNDILGYHTLYGYPIGTPIEIAKYVKERPAIPNFYGKIIPGRATRLVEGLYLRAIYVTINDGVNRKLKVVYYMAR